MSDRINLANRVGTLDISPQFSNYSKVRILVGQNDDGEDVVYEAGNDYGRTLEIENPFGTQAMANTLLQKLRGFQYQPFKADGALLDPAAEIGDGISVRNIYGGMYNRSREFSRLMKANIEAPQDEEIDHEFKYETKQERKYKRQFGDVRATLSIESDRITAEVAQRQADSAEFRSQLSVQATQIAARVTQTGGSQSSFGWSLLSNEFGLYAGNTKVFYVNSTGAHVKGEITATSGKIGNFNIGSRAIWNNISQYGGTQTTGVYLGTNGIQLGQRFFVDTYGNVTANNLTINGGSIKLGGTAQNPVFQVTSGGAVTATNLTIKGGSISIGGNFTVNSQGNLTANTGTFRGNVSAGNIQYGGNYGTFNAGGLTDGTIGSAKYGEYSIGSSAMGNGAVINRTIGGSAVSYGNVDFTGTLDQVGINSSNITSLQGSLADKRSMSNCNFDNLYLLKEGYYHSLYADYISIGGTQRKIVFWN